MAWPSRSQIDLLDPNPDDISIEDIAHHLAHQCRFNGGVPKFYSTAEHSVAVWRIARFRGADARLQRAALLHDAAEYALKDVIRPFKHHADPEVKKLMEVYKRIEGIWEQRIGEKFDAPLHPMHPDVKSADRLQLSLENHQLRNLPPRVRPRDFGFPEDFPPPIECWSPERSVLRFLTAFRVIRDNPKT